MHCSCGCRGFKSAFEEESRKLVSLIYPIMAESVPMVKEAETPLTDAEITVCIYLYDLQASLKKAKHIIHLGLASTI